MKYEDLHQRFGSHIARRVQVELSASEFKQVVLADLTHYLELRAEAAHKDYQAQLDNPLIDKAALHTEHMNALYNSWRDAEDLAYLVMVAEDVGAATRLVMVGGKG